MSTVSLEPSPTRTRSPWAGWIISPAWDLILFVATPLLIWPLVLLWQQSASTEAIWLLVISFASFGHHLPGFIRAYGDAGLFHRFRLRLLLVPPIILAVCWLSFAQGLKGLQVLILLWAIWHGLMQTYGFLRIYELKRPGGGKPNPRTARLDFAACIAIFVAGTILSDSRMYALLRVAYQAGLPIVTSVWLDAARWLVLAVAGGVAVAYAIHLVGTLIQERRIAWNKLLLLAATAWIWWLSGSAGVPVLLGVAMFEIYHAVQYLAIVWVFNRKTMHAGLARWGLPSAGWLLVIVYLGAIAAFGSLRYLVDGVDVEPWTPVILALLATSTLLHYYFDGFIWKVRESSNQSALGLTPTWQDRVHVWASGLRHGAKWALFFVPLGLITWLEMERPTDAASELARSQSLAEVAPHLSEAQKRLAEAAVIADRPQVAISALEKAIELNRDDLESYENQSNLLAATGDYPLAIDRLSVVLSHRPEDESLRTQLASLYLDQGRQLFAKGQASEAVEAGQKALEIQPDALEALWLLGLWQADDLAQARALWFKALTHDPSYPLANEALGLSLVDEAQHASTAGNRRRAQQLAAQAVVYLERALHGGRTEAGPAFVVARRLANP
jgi:tetratricopeptide (TPR) repeat protein